MKEEWKNIAGSTWIKVVLAAIIVIPMLYSGIFLGSMWDPYGNADKIPVAVVNEDNKVTYNGSSLHIGEDLVANLKKAKEMDFCFVDAAKASQGLKDGSYYMIITILKIFHQMQQRSWINIRKKWSSGIQRIPVPIISPRKWTRQRLQKYGNRFPLL